MLAALPTLSLPTDTTPVAEAAAIYAQTLGLPPVPLHGIREDGSCTCGRGAGCAPRSRGKHPVGARWQKNLTTDTHEVRDLFAEHTGNIGLCLANTRRVVLDADGEAGLETLNAWDVPRTLRAVSGSGVGAHLVYELAPNHDPGAITDRSHIPWEGVDTHLDVKIRGQFVVAPSRHISGRCYAWIDLVPIAVLPDWLYDRIRTPIRVVSAPPPTPSDASPDVLETRARKYLEKLNSAIDGAGGHNATFAAARALWGWVQKGLPESIAYSLLLAYNQRCQPPWAAHELAHKWEDAKKAHTIPVLEDRPRLYAVPSSEPTRGGPPSDPPPPPPPAEPEWRQHLRYKDSRNGRRTLISDVSNVIEILQRDPRWKGRIRKDLLRKRIVVRDPPWREGHVPTERTDLWGDDDTTRLHAWLSCDWHGYNFNPSRADVSHAVKAAADADGFHPVREYLEGLTWDGSPRLDRWLSTYLGAEANDYHALVGRWWLIGAVARVMRPGVKMDYVPILEGRQGLRKSSAIEVLAGSEWFRDTPFDINSKDAFQAIEGYWFVELAELDSLMGARSTRAKAFLSGKKNSYRRPYAEYESEILRQCVLVGTTNQSEYLTDATGARRYWPIACQHIDLDALGRDRDQIWAEAYAEFLDGKPWYPDDAKADAAMEPAQMARTAVDVWEGKIRQWVGARTTVTTTELAIDALNLPAQNQDKSASTRIGIIMRKLNWAKRRTLSGWVYEKDGDSNL